MFDIGFWELVILFGLGLLILGPERLPRVAMQLGNWAGQARRMARTLTRQIRDELDIDVNKPFQSAYRPPPASTYSRPGVDDLKPGNTGESSEPAETAAGPGSQAGDDTDSASQSQ